MSDLRKKLPDGALLCAYLVLSATPVIAMLFGIRGLVLYGVLTPTPRPEFEFARVLAEEYQHEFAAWFESDLGLKGSSIANDNTILYHAFGETKPGAPVRLGADGVLFLDQDIDYFNRNAWFAESAFYGAIAKQIARAQELLAARGKALVPILVPGKTALWPDKVPAAWRVPLGKTRLSDVRVYQRLITALKRHGVRFVDMRAKLTSSSVPRDLLFGVEARHWSSYGACLAMDEVASLYAELTGKPRPEHKSELEIVDAPYEDYDLYHLLNARFVPHTAQLSARGKHPPPPLAPRPSILFVGTSFCWNLLRDADASGLYEKLRFNSYNNTFETWPADEHVPVEPGTEAWREITFSKDLYVLDLFEVFFLPDSYVEHFLRDFVPELERTR